MHLYECLCLCVCVSLAYTLTLCVEDLGSKGWSATASPQEGIRGKSTNIPACSQKSEIPTRLCRQLKKKKVCSDSVVGSIIHDLNNSSRCDWDNLVEEETPLKKPYWWGSKAMPRRQWTVFGFAAVCLVESLTGLVTAGDLALKACLLTIVHLKKALPRTGPTCLKISS